jgi:3-oxoacyl-[acyl-carrier-protein] synthase-3
MSGFGIIGLGHTLPERVESNEELCALLPDTTPEWIVEKTGITQRLLAAPGDTASGYSADAARSALEQAGLRPEQLGLIVVCTFSGDYTFPPVSAKVAGALGATRAQTFDLQANCAGFVTGLTVAADRLRADDEVQYALVIGVELHTRFIDRADVDTAIYFSDGAGAAVLGPVEDGLGLQASAFHTDASNWEAVRFRAGGSSYPFADPACANGAGHIEQSGLATWKQAITNLPPTIRRACAKSGVELADVDRFVFHQANLNMLHYMVRKLRAPVERTYTNVERIGNTGAASVAIALSEARSEGAIGAGDTVVLGAVGAGFTFASSVWRWT